MAVRRLLGALLRVAAAAAALAAPASASAGELRFQWQDTFSQPEQARLTAWVQETFQALERLVGPFPMDVRVYFHRRDGAREPVPWANTQRYRSQGVHFHVDTGFAAEDFRRDWTAPHELSHLILPYVGRGDAWFAEGFASYLQYRVMQEMGVLTAAQAQRRYRRNVSEAASGYAYPDDSFVEAAPKLRSDRQYPVMYWGGAEYFRQVDEALASRGSSLIEVLRRYLACCREDRARLAGLLDTLDRLAPAPVFTAHYRRFASEPGFPGAG